MQGSKEGRHKKKKKTGDQPQHDNKQTTSHDLSVCAAGSLCSRSLALSPVPLSLPVLLTVLPLSLSLLSLPPVRGASGGDVMLPMDDDEKLRIENAEKRRALGKKTSGTTSEKVSCTSIMPAIIHKST